jgi:putative membrane protein
MKLLTEQERNEITNVIKEAEKKTSCEFVVAEISHCDDYNSARFVWGIIIALLVGLLEYIFYSPEVAYFTGAQFIGFLIGLLVISHIPFFKRLVLPRKKMQNEVRFRAMAEFYQQGLYKTGEENGILIMLSIFERMVVVLGDKGVHAKVPADYWDKMKDKIIEGIKQNKTGSTIVDVVKSSAGELSAHFPIKPGDINELPDEVIVEK